MSRIKEFSKSRTADETQAQMKIMSEIEKYLQRKVMSENRHLDQMPVRFKDAVGRKFRFPFASCKTWMVSNFITLATAVIFEETYHAKVFCATGNGSIGQASMFICGCPWSPS